jgi:hypothetical protein
MTGFISAAKSLLVILLQSRMVPGAGLLLLQEIAKATEKISSDVNIRTRRMACLTSNLMLMSQPGSIKPVKIQVVVFIRSKKT